MFEKEIEEYELIRQEYQQKIADRMGEKQWMEYNAAQRAQTNTSSPSSSKPPSLA